MRTLVIRHDDGSRVPEPWGRSPPKPVPCRADRPLQFKCVPPSCPRRTVGAKGYDGFAVAVVVDGP